MTPPHADAGFVRMPEEDFEAILGAPLGVHGRISATLQYDRVQ